MNPWLNYHHLFYFKTIAEEGSVSRAAEKLRLGQPTLSAQLKQFEEVLGIQLFERQHKRLILTEQGKAALEYAKKIFEMGHEMVQVLHDRLIPNRPHLVIGALDSIPKQIILQMAKAAYKIGRCQVTLIEGKPDEILRELTAHRVDLFCTNFVLPSEESKTLQVRSLSKKSVSIYGAKKFKGLRKDFPESLKDQHFIMPTFDSKLRYDLDHWLKTRGLQVDVIAETQDIGLKKLMASEEMGLIPAGSQTVNRQVLEGELIEIGRVAGVYEEIFLVAAQRRRNHPIASELMKSFQL